MNLLEAGVRSDLATAHEKTVAELGEAGTWLRSSEKIAVAQVVRAARDDGEKPPWYRPSEDGHEFSDLPAAALDAAWRLTNHPGTLTPDWYASTVEALPSPEYYIELVAVVASMNAIDRLATTLDFQLLPLPEAGEGDPTQEKVETVVSTHWVPIAADSTGPNVLKAFTAVPSTVVTRTRMGAAQYMDAAGRGDMNWSRGTLDRRQIELVAAVTSHHNECFY